MNRVRVILVALIAFSVAVVPFAGGMALAMPRDASFAAPPADCCPNGKPCENKTNGCDPAAACVLKCFNLTGAVAAPFVVSLPASALKKPALALRTFRSPAENPPLPPPRV